MMIALKDAFEKINRRFTVGRVIEYRDFWVFGYYSPQSGFRKCCLMLLKKKTGRFEAVIQICYAGIVQNLFVRKKSCLNWKNRPGIEILVRHVSDRKIRHFFPNSKPCMTLVFWYRYCKKTPRFFCRGVSFRGSFLIDPVFIHPDNFRFHAAPGFPSTLPPFLSALLLLTRYWSCSRSCCLQSALPAEARRSPALCNLARVQP